MNNKLINYRLIVPQTSINQVAGGLVMRGVKFGDMNQYSDAVTLDIKVPFNQVYGFASWFNQATDGRGQIK